MLRIARNGIHMNDTLHDDTPQNALQGSDTLYDIQQDGIQQNNIH